MQKVQAMIGILSKSEKKFLIKYLEVFHGSKDNKLIDFVRLVEKNPNITQDEASKKLYGDPKSKAFIMAKAKLLERLENVIQMGSGIHHNEAVESDPEAYFVIDSHKVILFALNLRKRGLSWYAKQILLEELKKPHVQIESALRLRLLELVRLNLDRGIEELEELEELEEEIKLTKKKADLEMLGAGIIQKYKVLTSIHNYSKTAIEKFLGESISMYEQAKKSLFTPLSHYYYLNMKVRYEDVKQNSINKKQNLEQLVKLSKDYPKLIDEMRKVFNLHYLGTTEISEGNYRAAIEYLDQAFESSKNRSENQLAILLAKSYALFYMGDMSGIEKCVSFCECLSNKEHLNILLVKYQRLVLLFIRKEYKLFFQFFVELDYLFQNKHHWNAALRVFEIISLIETHKTDIATVKIENLRKYIANNEVYPRYFFIFKILHQIELNAYNFSQNTKIDLLIEELNTKTKWDPIYLEMIKVDTWYRAKQNKVEYLAQFLVEAK